MERKYYPIMIVLILLAIFIGCSRGGVKGQKTGDIKKSVININVTPAIACIATNGRQRFSSSVDGVNWSTKSPFGKNKMGSINKSGLFAAENTPGYATIIASKNGSEGYAAVIIVADTKSCKSIEDQAKKITIIATTDAGKKEEEEDKEKKGKEPFGSTTKMDWKAIFDINLKYEVHNGEYTVGYIDNNAQIGFCFEVDGERLKVKGPLRIASLNVSSDAPTCEASAIHDTFFWIKKIKGKLIDTNFVFDKNFLELDHNEGHKLSCLHVSWSEPNASMINLMIEKAFPVTVEAKNEATTPIQGAFTFAGRKALIKGNVTISDKCP